MAPEQQHSFLSVIHATDDFPYGPAADQYYGLYLPQDDQPHGYLLPEVVEKMPWTSSFSINHDAPRRVTVIDSSAGTDTAGAINTAFQEVITSAIDQRLFHVFNGQHSEPFAIAGARYNGQVKIERFATPLFGITTRGAHMIAYTKSETGMKVWISRRAKHLYICPDMLDSTVAGGVKSGVSPFQTMIEESDEEASLSEDLIRRLAKCRGVVSHMSTTGSLFPGEKGLVCPDYVYIYDIELPTDVVPKPHDDEVSGFYLMDLEAVQAALLAGEFKPDAGAVVVEFLVRHGIITPENEPNFVEINMRLHRRLPFRTG
ncbi:Putative NUDIX hydrolase domain-containing protein [Septoria linicola]|uniref:NUDIX hydrolase domain-containing protein n=1 Tax=Septoria linicola TaxID=215465 RepID=A0A9Q9ANE2_9PEZI|nr:putative NUDIX hydrolase domain-containing protein [Septoria linicola]USW52160.1 Putative NUDIX hydrolase domain-containing protein [Septoria linicola]